MKATRTFGRMPTLGEMKEYYARDDVLSFLYEECQMRNIDIALRNKRWVVDPTSKAHLKDTIENTIEDMIVPAYRDSADAINDIRLEVCEYLSFHSLTSITSGEKLIGFDTIFEADMQGWRRSFEDLVGVIRCLDDFEVCYRMKYSGVRSLHFMMPFESFPKQFRGESVLSQQTEIQKKIGSYFRRRCGMRNSHGGQVIRLAYSLNEDNGLVSLPISFDELSSFRPWKANMYNVSIDKPWHSDIPSGASRKMLRFLREIYSDDEKARRRETMVMNTGLEIRREEYSDYISEIPAEEWMAQLGSDEEPDRVEAAWNLMRMPEAAPVSVLETGLADESPDVRWYLTEALQKRLDDDALELAGKMLWDDDQLVGTSAADAWMLSGGNALKVMSNLVTNSSIASMETFNNIMYIVQRAFQHVKPEAMQPFIDSVTDSAARFLQHAINSDEPFWTVRGYVQRLKAACRPHDALSKALLHTMVKLIVPRFFRDVRSEKVDYRLYIMILQEIRGDLVPMILHEVARSLEIDAEGVPSTRMAAEAREFLQPVIRSALADMTPGQKARIVAGVLVQGKGRLIDPSAKMLMRIGVSEAAEAMAHIFEQMGARPGRFVRVVNLLKQIDPAFERIFLNKVGNVDKARGLFGRSNDVPALIKALRDETAIHGWAISALIQTGDEAVPALAEVLEDENMQACHNAVYALGCIGGPAAAFALIDTLGHGNSKVRKRARAAMKRIGKPALPALMEALEKTEGHVRRGIILLLGGIGDPVAVPEIIKMLRDEHGGVRFDAARALETIGDSAAVPALIEVLKDENDWVRDRAVQSLRSIGTTEAMKAVEEFEESY